MENNSINMNKIRQILRLHTLGISTLHIALFEVEFKSFWEVFRQSDGSVQIFGERQRPQDLTFMRESAANDSTLPAMKFARCYLLGYFTMVSQ